MDPEGMISSGVLGPLGVAETFIPGQCGKRARFESNAIFKIRWSVLDELRGQDLGAPPRLEEYRGLPEQYSRAHVASLEMWLELKSGLAGEYGPFVVDHSAIDL